MSKKIVNIVLGLCALVLIEVGCKSQTCVVTATATGIGLRASYDEKTQMPLGELGYIHTAVAIVPTNRQADGEPINPNSAGGAQDTADVINEISFNNFFSFWNENGIYERVAVGKNACSQPGAVALFAKDSSGKVDPRVIEALNAVKNVPGASQPELDIKTQIAKLTQDDAGKTKLIAAMKSVTGKDLSYKDFTDGKFDVGTLNKILTELGK